MITEVVIPNETVSKLLVAPRCNRTAVLTSK
jgi:hypothetical protein